MTLAILYTLWAGIWNFIRGRGYSDNAYSIYKINGVEKRKFEPLQFYWLSLSKPACYFYVCAPLWHFFNWQTAIAIYIGILIPAWMGWGKVMQALKIEGNPDKVNEPESWLADKIADLICDKAVDKHTAIRKAIIWGNTFGFYSHLPIFLWLGYNFHIGFYFLCLSACIYGTIVSLFKKWMYFEFAWATYLFSIIIGFKYIVG
jgi:hypothetical protein